MVPVCHSKAGAHDIKDDSALFSLTYALLDWHQVKTCSAQTFIEQKRCRHNRQCLVFFCLVSALLCKLNILSILINIPVYILLTHLIPDTLIEEKLCGIKLPLSVLKYFELSPGLESGFVRPPVQIWDP